MILGTTVLVLTVFLSGIVAFFLVQRYRRQSVSHFFGDALKLPSPRSRFTEIDGVKLHYVVEGQGRDILLLHGMGASVFCWRYLIPFLSDKMRVWAVDIKGFGLSDKPKGSDYGLASQADLLLKFADKHIKNSFVVVGNSMGGAIAAEMNLQRPSGISHLVLVSAAYDPRIGYFDFHRIKYLAPMARPLVKPPLVKKLLKQVYGKPFALTEDIVTAYYTPYARGSEALHSLIESFDVIRDRTLKGRLKGLTAKTLILWGQNDRLIPRRFGEHLHEILPGSWFKTHEWAGHHPQEEDPQWVAAQIEQFLRNFDT